LAQNSKNESRALWLHITIATMANNHGAHWTLEEENRMIALLAQTHLTSADCDLIFANMFGRTPNAIHARRMHIGKRLLARGHVLMYVCELLKVDACDIV